MRRALQGEDEQRDSEPDTRGGQEAGGERRGEDLREAGGGTQMESEEGVCKQSQAQGEAEEGAREEQRGTRWKEKGQLQAQPS